MAFTSLTSGEILTGQPTSNTTATKIKDNFDNHEARLISVEGGGNVTYPPLIMRVNGHYDTLGATIGILKTVTNFALTITGIRIYIDEAGSSGSTEIDLKFSRAGGAYTSVLNTKPSVVFSAGNDAVSTNAILNSSYVDLEAGDILRLDTTSVQTGGRGFYVRIDYNKT